MSIVSFLGEVNEKFNEKIVYKEVLQGKEYKLIIKIEGPKSTSGSATIKFI